MLGSASVADCPAYGEVTPYPRLSSISVPPKLLNRAMLSTNSVSPLRACVLMYTLSWNELATSTSARTSYVLVHSPDA